MNRKRVRLLENPTLFAFGVVAMVAVMPLVWLFDLLNDAAGANDEDPEDG
jgi:hypothetical protein